MARRIKTEGLARRSRMLLFLCSARGARIQSTPQVVRTERNASLERFRVYGLEFESDMGFPGLPSSNGPTQVRIGFRTVPKEIEGVRTEGLFFQASDRQYLLRFDPVGSFLVQDGNQIWVDPAPGAPLSEIRHFLMGSPLGALFHQRGILVLHASAVATPEGAVLFAGLAATGKSTLACAFHLRGHELLADDMSCIDESGNSLYPGPAQAMLWRDGLKKLGVPVDALQRVREGVSKYRFSAPQTHQDPMPLRAIYILEPGGAELKISELMGFEKIATLSRHAYRVRDLALTPRTANPLDQTFALARHANIRTIRRPRNRFALDELVDAIVKDLEV